MLHEYVCVPALIFVTKVQAYMQKTCDVAEEAILAKKKLRKKCVNGKKCKSRQKCVNRENR